MSVEAAPQPADVSGQDTTQPGFDYAKELHDAQQLNSRADLIVLATTEQDNKVAAEVGVAERAATSLGVNETGSQSVRYNEQHPGGIPEHVYQKQQQIDAAMARAEIARSKGDELADVAGATYDEAQELRSNSGTDEDKRITDVDKAWAMAHASREAEGQVVADTQMALNNAARLGANEYKTQSTTYNAQFPQGERTDIVDKRQAIDGALGRAEAGRARADELADIAAQTYDQAQQLQGAGDGSEAGRIEDKDKAQVMANATREAEADITATTNRAVREVEAMGTTTNFDSTSTVINERFPQGEVFHIADKQQVAKEALARAQTVRAEADQTAARAGEVYDQAQALTQPRIGTEAAGQATVPEAPVSAVPPEVALPVVAPEVVVPIEQPAPASDALEAEFAAMRNDFGPNGTPRIPEGPMAQAMAEASAADEEDAAALAQEAKEADGMIAIARQRVMDAAATQDPRAMSEALKLHELAAILRGVHGAEFAAAKEQAAKQAEIVRNRYEKGQPHPELN